MQSFRIQAERPCEPNTALRTALLHIKRPHASSTYETCVCHFPGPRFRTTQMMRPRVIKHRTEQDQEQKERLQNVPGERANRLGLT